MSIEHLTLADELPVWPVDERVLTVDELAREFHVSTKTVCRWSRYGLVSRRFLLAGRKRVGYLRSSVDRFLTQNKERVRRSTQFSRMTDEERQAIVDQARCLAQAGGGLAQIISRIAQETSRSVETIRCTLRCFDAEHSDIAIFPYSRHPLRTETRTEIYQQYRRGDPVAALVQQFDQTPTQINDIINDLDSARIMGLPLDYIANEDFARVTSEKEEREILSALPEGEPAARHPRVPGGLPAYLASLYEVPLLTCKQESHLFRKMNYLKYKASILRGQLDASQPTSRLIRQIETLYDESGAAKTEIIRANLRLVVSIAKRYVGPAHDFFELVSDGNISLLRAVDKFDFSRGNKFSTYATWAITKNFARSLQTAARYNDRFCTNGSEIFSCTEDVRADSYEQESAQIQRESQVARILDQLDDRERQIVTARFGLIRGHEPLTLKQVGVVVGVTKERVRQIQARAMSRLKKAADEAQIECTA